jgi:hypothetical protein
VQHPRYTLGRSPPPFHAPHAHARIARDSQLLITHGTLHCLQCKLHLPCLTNTILAGRHQGIFCKDPKDVKERLHTRALALMDATQRSVDDSLLNAKLLRELHPQERDQLSLARMLVHRSLSDIDNVHRPRMFRGLSKILGTGLPGGRNLCQ